MAYRDQDSIASLGVVLDGSAAPQAWVRGEEAWFLYHREVLGHLALAYDTYRLAELDRACARHLVLLLPTVPALVGDHVRTLTRWVSSGGGLIICGDPGPLAELAGAWADVTVEEGHVTCAPTGPWQPAPDVALRAFGGTTLQPSGDAATLAEWVRDPGGLGGQAGQATAVTTRAVGAGMVTTFGVDVWQTLVRIHQGWPVTGDGVPPEDGTAPVDEGILKCDDGIALSYERDRGLAPTAKAFSTPFRYETPPSGPAPMFHRPHADMWRDVFAAVLFWTMEKVGRPAGWLGYWPVGIPAVAHMSHDSDGNTDDSARAALDAFEAADVRVTWCFLHPGGYSAEIYKDVIAAGHEPALHYNAMAESDLAYWGEDYLAAQLTWVRQVTGTDSIVSNKNHYTRWEGWAEFYLWCERLGIQIDQSRGPSKQGNVGFPFGTCHVTFPMSDRAHGNRLIGVLSLPMQTQDLWLTNVIDNRAVFLDQALEHHGVAHFLFHGRNIVAHEEVRNAVLETVAEGRRRGMPWWTSAEINAWERKRRHVRIVVARSDDSLVVTACTPQPVDRASILLCVPGLNAGPTYRVVSGDGEVRAVRRHRRRFLELATDLAAGTSTYRLASE
jgi:hypothetical protein